MNKQASNHCSLARKPMCIQNEYSYSILEPSISNRNTHISYALVPGASLPAVSSSSTMPPAMTYSSTMTPTMTYTTMTTTMTPDI